MVYTTPIPQCYPLHRHDQMKPCKTSYQRRCAVRKSYYNLSSPKKARKVEKQGGERGSEEDRIRRGSRRRRRLPSPRRSARGRGLERRGAAAMRRARPRPTRAPVLAPASPPSFRLLLVLPLCCLRYPEFSSLFKVYYRCQVGALVRPAARQEANPIPYRARTLYRRIAHRVGRRALAHKITGYISF
jgi:hypothetical protein